MMPHGHAEGVFENVRSPRQIFAWRRPGFEIAQGALVLAAFITVCA
ncbi:MAG: hypothetical protein CM1200mP18_21090 [Gammaproteobacteria bacterium]|nr:MAG: hypothetical protein CM1200mP18_21090 [Gammaproteobacteria bacterium]